MQAKATREITIRDLCYAIFRFKWRMILVAAAIFATVATMTFLQTTLYRSEAKLLLERDSPSLDPATGQISRVSQDRQRELNSELEILLSRELAERVIDSIGPGAFSTQIAGKPAAAAPAPDGSEKTDLLPESARRLIEDSGHGRLIAVRTAVSRLVANLEVEAQKATNIIAISFLAKEPKLAQTVVTELIDLYREKHVAVHKTAGSYEFLANQFSKARNDLAQIEETLRKKRSETGVFALEAQGRALLDRIGGLERDLERTDAEVSSSGSKVHVLQDVLAKLPETVVLGTRTERNEAAEHMRERLYDLRLEQKELLSKSSEAVRRQIIEGEKLLDQEGAHRLSVTQGRNTTHQSIELQLLNEKVSLVSAQAKREAILKQLEEARKRARVLNDEGRKIASLEREVLITEANYRRYAGSLEQARIDEALQIEKISNISVVQPATLPINPARPRTMFNLAIGLFLAIGGAVGIALVSGYLDHTIKTPEEVRERLHVATLASIPRASRKKVLPSGLSVKLERHYGSLAERLLLNWNGTAETPRVIAITSCQRREGVSSVAANLAVTLARHDSGNVLLVDADIEQPSVQRIFEVNPSPGLAEALGNGAMDKDDGLIQSLPRENLHVVSAGVSKEDAANALNSGSGALAQFLHAVKSRYRFVLVDVPALNGVTTATRVATLCDGVVLVVESGRLRWQVIHDSLERLRGSNAEIIGAVLNKRTYPVPKWLYRTL